MASSTPTTPAGNPQPAEQGSGVRWLYCPGYTQCLRAVSIRKWKGFTCGDCDWSSGEDFIDLEEVTEDLGDLFGQRCPVCERPSVTNGLCQLHYQRWHRETLDGLTDLSALTWGLLQPWDPAADETQLCSHPDCLRPIRAAGLCHAHYQRKWRAERAAARERARAASPSPNARKDR